MSGTSLDGVDGVLALDTAAEAAESAERQARSAQLRVIGHVHRAFDPALRADLLALNTPGAHELHRAALATNGLMRLYAEVVAALLRGSGLPRQAVRAVGAHGQTVRHRPGEFDGTGYTLQLMQGALLAELCGIDVVCDFRSRDVAAGGQGAPLVPAFHAAWFGQTAQTRGVLNLGGIANLTVLGAQGQVSGFDCGPGNVLMDHWVQRQRGLPYDAHGAWAASGQVQHALLQRCLAEPFLHRAPPKSTGRDLFTADWLAARLQDLPAMDPADVMATLAEFTAHAAAQALKTAAPDVQQLLVCGGGARNAHLLQRLQALAGVPVASCAEAGVQPDQVEALAFAWLARQFMQRRPGNLPAVTGAAGLRVLGALHPA